MEPFLTALPSGICSSPGDALLLTCLRKAAGRNYVSQDTLLPGCVVAEAPPPFQRRRLLARSGPPEWNLAGPAPGDGNGAPRCWQGRKPPQNNQVHLRCL
ncbi:unnamed protein product [Eretmochelys imbricata]